MMRHDEFVVNIPKGAISGKKAVVQWRTGEFGVFKPPEIPKF
jgi:hypothetical protein